MKKGAWLVALVLACVFAPAAHAQETVWDMANSQQYGKKAGGMIGRGLLNAATCFVDILVQTVHGTQEGPPFVGTLSGLGTGIACTALRATSGVLDVATFWVPGFNGFPVSRSYADCLEYEETPESAPQPVYTEPAPTYAAPAVPDAGEQPAEASQEPRDAMEYVKK